MRKDVPGLQPALHRWGGQGHTRRILVTGHTGFIGKVVTEKLLARGESVIGYSKSQGGDILDYYTLKEAMKSCDRVIHLAAKISFDIKDAQRISQINFIGTHNVMKAALANDIKKVVYVSSAITRGIGMTKDFILTEELELDTNAVHDAYALSKLMAERVSIAGPINVSIVFPTTVMSPEYIKTIRNNIVPVAPCGGTNIIAVEDVADGIILALDIGADKSGYILSNINITYKNLFEKISGRRAIVLPKWSLRTAKYLARYAKDKYTSPFTVNNSFFYKYYSNSKAKNELGWTPKISLEEMLK